MLRRTFVKAIGVGAAGAAGGRLLDEGRVIGPWTRSFAEVIAAEPRALLLHNNENPLGPGEQALAAIRETLAARGVPAARYTSLVPDLEDALAAHHRCSPDNVLVGCGSTQILRTAALSYTSRSRPLVAGSPAYEECGEAARLAGASVRAVRGTRTLHHDLDAMAAAAAADNAGLIYFDNPSNPAATLHPAGAVTEFIGRVLSTCRDAHLIVDEAYHDYVTDPGHQTQIPLALANPRVIVARTFSKAFGMAGLRVGYAIAQKDTVEKMREWQYSSGTNVLGLSAALATLPDRARIEQEARRNADARQFTIEWFRRAGLPSADSQANFIFVDIRRPAAVFRDGCARHGIRVGRDFPPFEKTHARISIGTIDEMKRAVQVFGRVLGVRAAG